MKEGFRRICIVGLVAGCYLTAWRLIFVTLPSQKNTEDYVFSAFLAVPVLALSCLLLAGLAALLCWIADGFSAEKSKETPQRYVGPSGSDDNGTTALLVAGMAMNTATMTSVSAGSIDSAVACSVADSGASVGADCSSASSF